MAPSPPTTTHTAGGRRKRPRAAVLSRILVFVALVASASLKSIGTSAAAAGAETRRRCRFRPLHPTAAAAAAVAGSLPVQNAHRSDFDVVTGCLGTRSHLRCRKRWFPSPEGSSSGLPSSEPCSLSPSASLPSSSARLKKSAGSKGRVAIDIRLRLRGGDAGSEAGTARQPPSATGASVAGNVTAATATPDERLAPICAPHTPGLTLTDKVVGRAFVLLLGWAIAAQAVGSLLNHEDIIEEVSKRLLSEETAGAVKTIRRILSRFADHGVVDVLSLHPPKDVMTSMLALSRLQQAAVYCASEERDRTERLVGGNGPSSLDADDRRPGGGSGDVDPRLLSDLAHYAVFANAAYGWKGGLALFGRLHWGDVRALTTKTGIGRDDVLDANWHARTHRPAYFLVRDIPRRRLVLSIRGTFSARDVLTDLCCAAEDFWTCDDADSDAEDQGRAAAGAIGGERFADAVRAKYRARAHQGMLDGARGVARTTRRIIASELAARPDYDLVIVGHSLGGGTAAVLGSMWRETFPGLAVYAYGCPCVGPLDVHPTTNDRIVSVVGEGDPFSCLSLGHLADLSAAISQLCEDEDLRSEILRRTQGGVRNMTEEDLRWSFDAMEGLRQHMTGEKFYPPGRILHMRGAVNGNGGGNELTLREVTTDKFRELKLHPRMLDLTRHVPNRYESALKRLWLNASEGSSNEVLHR